MFMSKYDICDLLKDAITSRRVYLYGLYLSIMATSIFLLSPYLFIFSAILLIGGIALTVAGFFLHSELLYNISKMSAYTPFHWLVALAVVNTVGIAIEIASYIMGGTRWFLITTIILFVLGIIVFLTIYKQMYREIEKALLVDLSDSYIRGLIMYIVVSVAIITRNHIFKDEGTSIMAYLPMMFLIYLHFDAFHTAYVTAKHNICRGEIING